MDLIHEQVVTNVKFKSLQSVQSTERWLIITGCVGNRLSCSLIQFTIVKDLPIRLNEALGRMHETVSWVISKES